MREIYRALYEECLIKTKRHISLQLVKGNFPLTKIFLEQFRKDNLLFTKCSISGKVQILKWLRRHKVSPDRASCPFAGYYGHLQVLKWMRTSNMKYGTPIPWEESCLYAVRGGQLKILKWLRTPSEKYGTPCPWGERTYYHASSDETRQWLIENGCPLD